jgi:hypothetical protein
MKTATDSAEPKTLEAEDASRLARLAYRVVLGEDIEEHGAIQQMKSVPARQIAKAVLGSSKVDADAIAMADELKAWARRNAGIQPLSPD